MAKRKNQSPLSSDNLKQTLWETLQDLRAKKIEPILANSIASQSREIMRVVHAEIRLAELTGSSLPKIATKRVAGA